MNQQSTIKKFWSQPIESTELLLSVLLFVGALPSPVSCSNTPRKTWHHRPWHCAQHNLTAIRFSTWRLHWFHLNQCTGQLEYRHHQSKLATNTHMTHMSHMTIETSKRILHNTPQQLWKIEASTHEKPIARSPKKTAWSCSESPLKKILNNNQIPSKKKSPYGPWTSRSSPLSTFNQPSLGFPAGPDSEIPPLELKHSVPCALMGDVPETTWAGSRVMENSAFFGREKGMKNPSKPGDFKGIYHGFSRNNKGRLGLTWVYPSRETLDFENKHGDNVMWFMIGFHWF